MTVNTNITDLNEYLQHILKSTNMKCLTPEKVGMRLISYFLVELHISKLECKHKSSPHPSLLNECVITLLWLL